MTKQNQEHAEQMRKLMRQYSSDVDAQMKLLRGRLATDLSAERERALNENDAEIKKLKVKIAAAVVMLEVQKVCWIPGRTSWMTKAVCSIVGRLRCGAGRRSLRRRGRTLKLLLLLLLLLHLKLLLLYLWFKKKVQPKY